MYKSVISNEDPRSDPSELLSSITSNVAYQGALVDEVLPDCHVVQDQTILWLQGTFNRVTASRTSKLGAAYVLEPTKAH
jgi:hypothetical protein